jgi:hypothetical protein
MKQKRSTLWMRYVQFDRIVWALQMLARHPNGFFRAGELESEGIRQAIFVGRDGHPFSRSTLYHYRKVMEGLGLIQLQQGTYSLGNNPLLEYLLSAAGVQLQPLGHAAKEVLAQIVSSNGDCRRTFFDLMMADKGYNLEELRSTGQPIQMLSSPHVKPAENLTHKPVASHGRTRSDVVLKSIVGISRLDSADLVNAVAWGVRLWARDLGITDEIITDSSEGHLICPVSSSLSSMQVEALLCDTIREQAQPGESQLWAIAYVPHLMRAMLVDHHVPLDLVQDTLLSLFSTARDTMMLLPTSTAFIDIKTPFSRQDQAFRNAYLRAPNGTLISHIRVRRDILPR